MNLTLEIISPNGQSLGAARRKVFGVEGGRIGRSPECEWVLANPYVSRHHATIRWISGTYYVESTGENGVAVNSPQAMLPQLERRALKHGDRLYIDEYEVAVGLGSVTAEAAPTPAYSAPGAHVFAPSDDPFDLSPTAVPAPALVTDPFQPTNDELDPLKQLKGRPPASAVTAPRADAAWNHTPGVSDHFSPPPVPAPAQAIPDDWDKTTFGRPKVSPQAASTAARPETVSSPGSVTIPDDWDKTTFGRGKQTPAAAPAPTAAASAHADATVAPTCAAPEPVTRASVPTPLGGAPRPSSQKMSPMPGQAPSAGVVSASLAELVPGVSAGHSAAAQPTPVLPSMAPTPAGVATSTPRPASQRVQSGTDSSGFDIASVLRAAGVDLASVPPETAGALGLILRSVVQGVIEVLQARAEIKNQFRLPLTRVKTAENNPLKFSVNAEDALNSLLGRRNPAYLPPVEAFEDAFNDIRFHQLAMLAGMRAGFEHVMSRFDPEQLQKVFDKQVKRGGLLSMSSKSRYWELYGEQFRELSGDPDETFRRLFGEEFADAYEKQLDALKRSRGSPQR
jgi:type VI secretion system FHA domain protein